MKRNWILLNLTLFVVTLVLGYQLKKQWRAYWDTHSSAKIKPSSVSTPQLPASASKGVVAPNYSAIVDKHLFNLERNNVIPADPLPAAETKVLAPKPILMGMMGLAGNTYALMVSGSGGDSTLYRRLKIGEQLDGYTLVRVLHDKVVMNADGKEVDVSIADQPRPRSQQPATAGGSAAVGASKVSAVGSAASPSTTAHSDAPQVPAGDAPEGTVFNGRRKRIVPSPFGPTIVWEDVK